MEACSRVSTIITTNIVKEGNIYLFPSFCYITFIVRQKSALRLAIILQRGNYMRRPLQNLHLLKADMEQKGWMIDSFKFSFKKINYIVLVILFAPGEPKAKYALVQLDFLNSANFKHHLLVSANAGGIMLSAEELRRFFGIRFSENLGDILQQFTELLGFHIPEKVSVSKTKIEQIAITHKMTQTGCEEPDKIYCYTVKRNPIIVDAKTGEKKQTKRTEENDSKTRMLRRTLYDRLGKDASISFCYSNDPAMSRTDEEIISNWTARKTENESGMAVL